MPAPLATSLALAATLGAAAFAHTWSVTDGFDRMTFESLRAQRVARGELSAPAVAVTLVDGTPRALWPGPSPTAPRAWLVDFVSARCPGVCQALGGDYRQMAEALRADPEPGVQLVSLSVATPADTAAELAAYARTHHADGRQWWVARADADDTRRLLRALSVIAIPDGQGGLVHNGDIHLVDASGRVRGLYAWDEWPRALAAARRLAGAAR